MYDRDHFEEEVPKDLEKWRLLNLPLRKLLQLVPAKAAMVSKADRHIVESDLNE